MFDTYQDVQTCQREHNFFMLQVPICRLSQEVIGAARSLKEVPSKTMAEWLDIQSLSIIGNDPIIINHW